MNGRLVRAGACAALLLLARAAAGQTPEPPEAPPPADEQAGPSSQLPPGIDIDFSQMRQTEEGDVLFLGPVTLRWKGSRIQADRITLRGKRYLWAEGNVLVVWGGNRIFGATMSYDLEEERGELEEVVGQIEDEYLFWASHAEKIGDDLVRLKRATVTTCTQPTPYWSFSVSSATIRLDHYARMWNVRLRARKLPLIYLPYMIWPVKRDRAPGLLMPEIHTTRDRGRAITQELFIPIGQSADVTLVGRYYTKAGFGGGGELRFIPNAHGAGYLNGFYINDKVQLDANGRPTSRYRAEYRQTQEFLNGFRMVADMNLVSDFDYFSDFERELNLVSSPTILARLEFSRNGPWTSLNVRELRREQLRSGGGSLIQQTLPEIEWRGRSRKLGRTPLYLSYESSLASIQQRETLAPGATFGEIPPLDVDYVRGDVFPTLSMPISPVPWLELTPEVSYRLTHYTQRRAVGSSKIDDHSLTRQLWSAGLELAGPKLYKIFERPNGKYSTAYKHSIEPRLTYGYGKDFARADEILLYDEVDRFGGTGNQINYSLVQRLFAKRPRSAATQLPAQSESVFAPDPRRVLDTREAYALPVEVPQAAEPVQPEPEQPEEEAPLETVEIASFELRQSRSFERDDLSSADLNGDGQIESKSPYSAVQLIGRFNPTTATTLDLRSSYDILYDRFRDTTLSGSIRAKLARMSFSVVHRNGLGVRQINSDKEPIFGPVEDEMQVRLNTGLSLFRGKLQLDVNGSWNANPAAGNSHLSDLRWQVQYATQCCTFYVERLSRSFTSQSRQDYYFRVDLKGIGKLLDFKY